MQTSSRAGYHGDVHWLASELATMVMYTIAYPALHLYVHTHTHTHTHTLHLHLHLSTPTLVADIISTVEFNHDGEFLATGDKGGRVVIFQRVRDYIIN